MVRTVLKIDGMMCGMCESHMNDLYGFFGLFVSDFFWRSLHVILSVSSSSAKKGETVVISEESLDIPMLEKEIKEIGYELVSHTSEPYEKKGLFRR